MYNLKFPTVQEVKDCLLLDDDCLFEQVSHYTVYDKIDNFYYTFTFLRRYEDDTYWEIIVKEDLSGYNGLNDNYYEIWYVNKHEQKHAVYTRVADNLSVL